MNTAKPSPDAAGSESAKTPPPAAKPVRRGRLWLKRMGILAGILIIFGGGGLGGAEYYTSRPQFCGTCHIMEPYFESWSHDVHGAKFGVRCVDCHYAPGEQHTLNAKFRGLSQVASYFSGRYGSSRPRAKVDNASCLRSGCHGGQAFASKMLLIGEARTEKRMINEREVEVQRAPSVHFVHDKHLKVEEMQKQLDQDAVAITTRLKTAVGDANFAKIEKVTKSVRTASEREQELKLLSSELRLTSEASADALALQKLEHRRVRVGQLSGLNCSACHAFNASLKSHIAADRQVCFSCHFTHEEFNRDTGECLRCHEPPTRSVQVHGSATGSKPMPSVLMDHSDIVKRGVNCASCHFDVVRGDTAVNERDCQHCHDQSRYMEEFAARTTDTVKKYHAVHIAGQKAHCFDCHRAMQHGLAAAAPVNVNNVGFLEPVLNDCQHCHPAHHREQVALLTGTGGAGLEHAQPNPMVGSRLNCRACHTQSGGDAKGDDLVRASREGCVGCHGPDYLTLFDQWKHEIKTYLDETSTLLTSVKTAIAARKLRGEALPDGAEALLANAEQNIHLVTTGGGMHNRSYAMQLLDGARRDLTKLQEQLGRSE